LPLSKSRLAVIGTAKAPTAECPSSTG